MPKNLGLPGFFLTFSSFASEILAAVLGVYHFHRSFSTDEIKWLPLYLVIEQHVKVPLVDAFNDPKISMSM